MNSEMGRHKWKDLENDGVRLPGWIEQFLYAEGSDEVGRLSMLIESAVAPVNGPLRPGADAVAACLIQGLLVTNSIARTEVLYLIFQIAGGTAGSTNSRLAESVRREVELGLPIICGIAETGSRTERLQCIDLLSICATFNEESMSRAVSTMRKIACRGEAEANAVAVELEDLGRSQFREN